jgi:NADH-quinone oxidoreductase subunit C
LTPEDAATALTARFGEDNVETSSFRGDYCSVVLKSSIVDVLMFMRGELKFDHLSDITAVDRLGRLPRFDVVYHLFSYTTHVWYRLKVKVNEDETVPTAIPVFSGSNWAEREIYDLFGIRFAGHPDMHRLFLPEGWVGHPLRKDYPMSQITLPRSGATKIPD